MNEHDHDIQTSGKWTSYVGIAKYRFAIMVAVSIAVALALVGVSMMLYSSSGTAELDLSRIEYREVRDKVKSEEVFDGFKASGAIDQSALSEFQTMYEQRAKNTTAADVFTSDVLSDQTLGIDQPPTVDQH